MVTDQDHRNQHIVSKAYLNHFSSTMGSKYPKVCVCRKNPSGYHTFIKSTHKIGYIKDFYNVSTRIDPKFWEKYFSIHIEPGYKATLDGIISKTVLVNRNIPILNTQDKLSLGRLIAFQIMRVPSFMDNRIKEGLEIGQAYWKIINRKIGNILSSDQKNKIMEYLLLEDGIKDLYLENITNEQSLENYAHVLMQRTWLIIYNNTDMPFFTSDNPVLVFKQGSSLNETNYGIGYFDSDIYYPLSSHVMLYIVPNWLIGPDVIIGDRHFICNSDLELVKNINLKQYYHARELLFCDPYFKDQFEKFIKDGERMKPLNISCGIEQRSQRD